MSATGAIKGRAAVGALLCASLLSGCSGQSIYSGYREMDQMELVETIAADRTDDGITVLVATNAEHSDSEATVLKNTGESISEALEGVPAFTPKQHLFFGHTKNFIIGGEAARKGLAPYLDYVERAVEMRLDTRLFIAPENTVEELMSGDERISKSLDSIEESVKALSEGFVYSFDEVAQSLLHNGAALVAAIGLIPAEEHEPGAESGLTVFLGYAVIADGRLAAVSDAESSRGINLLTDKVEGGMVEAPDGMGGVASLSLTRSEMDVEPVYGGDGRLERVLLSFDLKLNIEELQGPVDVFDDAVMAGLEREAAELEKSRVEAALALVQEADADCLGLGKRVELAAPSRFEKLPEPWAEVFGELELEVRVGATIERSYDIAGFAG